MTAPSLAERHELLEAVQKWNLLIGLAMGVGALVFLSDRMALGVIVGVILSCVNFWAMQKLLARIIGGRGRGRLLMQILLGSKLLIVMGAVYLAMKFLPVEPIGMAVGMSVFVVSIVVETLRFSLTPAAPADPSASSAVDSDSSDTEGKTP